MKLTMISLLIPLLSVVSGLGAQCTDAEFISIAVGADASVSIICPDNAEIIPVSDYLIDYLKARTPSVNEEVLHALPDGSFGTHLILADEKTLSDLQLKGLNAGFPPDAHPDSFILDVRNENGVTSAYLIGKSPAGVRQAVSRFMQKLRYDGRTLSIEGCRDEKSPFISTRLVMIAPTARRQIQFNSRFEDANYEVWETERLRKYPGLFLQFGFSGIQIAEVRGYGRIEGEYLRKAQNAVNTLALGAQDYDLFVSLDQWGDCPFVEGQALCWELPEERKVLEDFFLDLANRHGPLVDHIYIHVGDPGGATHGGCTKFKTPQLLTAGILELFRRVKGTDILATMSTWANAEFWKHSTTPVSLNNYPGIFRAHADTIPFGQPIPDGGCFLDDTFMPLEIGIAQHRVFNQQQADMLEAAGRSVDVWGWYIGDHEMHNNLTLNMTNVDKHYKALPDKASRQIRMQTVELCFHGWPQIINTYVAAQLMWDPRRPLAEIEREFCSAAFGPQNADAVHALYKACENPWDYDVWQTPLEYIPRPADLGTAAGNTRMRGVLEAVESVHFPQNWLPNFDFPVPVERYLEMLTARLRLTLAYSEAKLAVDTARREKRSETEIKRIKENVIHGLPDLSSADPLFRQDETTAKSPAYQLPSWAEHIRRL